MTSGAIDPPSTSGVRRRLLAACGAAALAGCERKPGGGEAWGRSDQWRPIGVFGRESIRLPRGTPDIRADGPVLLPSPGGDAIVYDAADPSSPLSLFRLAITRRIQNLSDRLSAGSETEFDKLKRFMNYIDRFRSGEASATTPDATVIEQVGLCGTFVHTLLALARCQGLAGRYVNLYNFPVHDGHSICEIFLAGRWILFDPTYNLCYSSSIHPEREPLSFDQIQRELALGADLVILGGSARQGMGRYSGAAAYAGARPKGVIGPACPMWFPLDLDLRSSASVSRADLDARYQGADYLGAATANVQQVWTLSGLDRGQVYRFEMKSAWLGGDKAGNLGSGFVVEASMRRGSIVRVAGNPLDFSRKALPALTVHFVAAADSAQLTLEHPYRGPLFRYVAAAGYSLTALS